MAYHGGVNPRLHAAAAVAALLATASCSDDPAAPTTTVTGHGYDATVALFAGRVDAFCGRGEDEVYAGDEILMRWDGERWRPVELPPGLSDRIDQVWFAANGDMYLRAWTRIWRFDGAVWDYTTSPAYEDVWGAPDGTLFSASWWGTAYRYNGSHWIADTLTTTDNLGRVSGDRSDNVYVGGSDGFIAHFDGTAWHTTRTDSLAYVRAVWQFGARPMYASVNSRVVRLDGTTLTPMNPDPEFRVRDAWPVGTDGLCVAGDSWEPEYHGAVYAYDGARWTEILTGPNGFEQGWTSPAGTVYATDGLGVWRSAPAGAEQILGTDPRPSDYYDEHAALWAAPDGTVVSCGVSAHRLDGASWVNLGKESLTAQRVIAVHGRSGEDFYAVGSAMILHYDGRAWDWVSSGFQNYLSDVWTGRDEVLVTSEGGRVIRLRGGQWEVTETGTTRFLNAVSGWEGGAWAVGEGGVIRRYDGGAWHPVASPTGANLLDVAALGPDFAVAVGDLAESVFVYDGRAWRSEPIDGVTSAYYTRVQVAGPRDIVAAGDGPVVRFDGNTWSQVSGRVVPYARGLALTGTGDIFLSGGSAVLRYRRR